MSFNPQSAEKYIEQFNLALKQGKATDLGRAESAKYCEAFKVFFEYTAREVKSSSSEEESTKLLKQIFLLNYLHAIAITANYAIGEELLEIANDFDNIDYPAYGYLIRKIKNNEYKLLQTGSK